MEREVSPLPFAGMVGVACAFFLYAATPVVLDAPWWALVLLMLVWAAALVLACRWFTRRPVALAWLPVGLMLGWFALMVVGARYLGWA